MFLLICSFNLLTIIFGWEGLGFTSFFLIFFFNNNDRWKRGIKTFINNKIGDSIILLSIVFLLLNNEYNYVTYIFVFSLITKRAQFPFMAWLPIAIAAPTPISAIVHSSTLVTAGLYILFRSFNLIYSYLNIVFFVDLCLISIFFSRLKAVLEKDIKKMIALSTLRQIGLIMFIILLNFKFVAFIYICNHAFFKSLLFINIGFIIMRNFSSQFSYNLNVLNLNLFFNLSFKISCFNLINLAFFSSFFVKEILMNFIFSNFINLLVFFIFLFSSFLTINYSLKLLLFNFNSNFKIKFFFFLGRYNYLSFFLINVFSIFFRKTIINYYIVELYLNVILINFYLVMLLINFFLLKFSYRFVNLLIYLNFLIYIFPIYLLKKNFDYVELWIEKFTLNFISSLKLTNLNKFLNINFKISLLLLILLMFY